MRKATFTIAIIFLFGFYYSVNAQVIRGNGNVKTDVRNLSGFTEIIAQGNFNLILTQGDKEGVKIETDENIVELFQTRIDGKRLFITMVADVRKSGALNIYLSIKELNSIILLNNISLKTEGVIHFDELSIFSGGMSQVEMELFATKLNLQLVDGTYAYLKGYAESFSAEIHDETELNAFDMQTDSCNVLSSGLTEVSIDVQKDLKLLVTGGSNLYYTGNPKVSQRIFSSTGFIVKRKLKK